MNSITSGDQREAARANRFHQRFGKKKEYHHVEDHEHVDDHDHVGAEVEMDHPDAERENRFHHRFGKQREYHHVDEDHVEEHPHGNDHGKVEIDHADAGRENRFHQRFGNNREYRHVEEHTLSGVGGTCSVADGSTKEGEGVSMSNDHGIEDGKIQRTAPRKEVTTRVPEHHPVAKNSLQVENCWTHTPAIPFLRPRIVSKDVGSPSGTFTAQKQQQNVLQYVKDKRAEKSNFPKVCVC